MGTQRNNNLRGALERICKPEPSQAATATSSGQQSAAMLQQIRSRCDRSSARTAHTAQPACLSVRTPQTVSQLETHIQPVCQPTCLSARTPQTVSWSVSPHTQPVCLPVCLHGHRRQSVSEPALSQQTQHGHEHGVFLTLSTHIQRASAAPVCVICPFRAEERKHCSRHAGPAPHHADR